MNDKITQYFFDAPEREFVEARLSAIDRIQAELKGALDLIALKQKLDLSTPWAITPTRNGIQQQTKE